MSLDKLDIALNSIKWSDNIKDFLKQNDQKEKLNAINLRLAIWLKQLEQVDRGNPALTFVREMQTAGQMAVALTSLCLYKPAASSIRTVIETALYYTYFRTHPAELSTLIRDKNFYVSKGEIIEYHKIHTDNFRQSQEKMGLLSKLEVSYSLLSSIVHGQLPGIWSQDGSLKNIKPNKATEQQVVQRFSEGEDIVHRLFLCTIAPEMWGDFSTTAKKALLKGLSGDLKTILALDEG